MYAPHLECRSLLPCEFSVAVAGRTNLTFGIEEHQGTVKMDVLPPISTCHTFDESADGYERAEPGGALHVKWLSDAVASGNFVQAAIWAAVVNASF